MSIGTRILITETWGNLEIFIESSHHQELFILLRSLWESIELPRVDPRRDQVVTSSLGRRDGKYRSLDLEKSMFDKPIASKMIHPRTEGDRVERCRTSKIKVSIPETYFLIRFSVIGYLEREGIRTGENRERMDDNFDIACRKFVVRLSLGTSSDESYCLYNELRTERVCQCP
jgi:hypothetical protein